MSQPGKTSTHTQVERKAKYHIIKSTSVLTTEKLTVFRPASPQAHCVTKAMTISFSDPLSEDNNVLCQVRTARTAAASNHLIKATDNQDPTWQGAE